MPVKDKEGTVIKSPGVGATGGGGLPPIPVSPLGGPLSPGPTGTHGGSFSSAQFSQRMLSPHQQQQQGNLQQQGTFQQPGIPSHTHAMHSIPLSQVSSGSVVAVPEGGGVSQPSGYGQRRLSSELSAGIPAAATAASAATPALPTVNASGGSGSNPAPLATMDDDLLTPNSLDVTAGVAVVPRTVTSTSTSSLVASEPKNRMESRHLSPYGGQDLSKLSKRESLKVQKRHYRHEKKRAANELLTALKDPSVIIIADWLKVRGSLKSWTKLWVVLKPGLLVLYKSHKTKSSHWVATVLLSTCEVLERPSKKDGFCFKVFHPLEQSIWATKGPKGENIGAITQPLPYSYLIFRAPSEAAGKCWMDALELALHCSSLLMRTMTKEHRLGTDTFAMDTSAVSPEKDVSMFTSSKLEEMDESDCERHFEVCGLDEETKTDREDKDEEKTETESEEEEEETKFIEDTQPPVETPYVENTSEELGQQGDACQTEEVADENKSLIWSLVKQVRPGMDLSKVVLPTFILEPRSFLDKLSDYYYHADLLSEAVLDEDPFTRMKSVVRWYLSGFYKKPKGLKKPYNPILGETFRCCWKHPKTGSRTFFIAEQDGFAISGSILTKSKFYGNSLSAILDGAARLVFLKRGEDYVVTMPYAHCKGILIGTLTMEMGGEISIHCEKTGYRADLEFKLKPFLGSGEASNRIVGKIKLGDETLATLDGRWDQEIHIKDKRQGDAPVLFWNPTPEVKSKRLHRYTVHIDSQADFESERLWAHTSAAILRADQMTATQEKCLLEEQQRIAARERKAKMEEWVARFFERSLVTGEWAYRYADLRPWDPMNDVLQFERDFVIQTKTRHQTPIVHTMSISNTTDDKIGGGGSKGGSGSHSRHPSSDCSAARAARMKRASLKHSRTLQHAATRCGSGSSEADIRHGNSESSLSDADGATATLPILDNIQDSNSLSSADLAKVLEPLLRIQQENNDRLSTIQAQLTSLDRQIRHSGPGRAGGGAFIDINKDVLVVAFMLLVQLVFFWWLK